MAEEGGDVSSSPGSGSGVSVVDAGAIKSCSDWRLAFACPARSMRVRRKGVVITMSMVDDGAGCKVNLADALLVLVLQNYHYYYYYYYYYYYSFLFSFSK